MTLYPDSCFIAAGGGSSSRFGSKNKLLEELAGKPVFLHCLLAAADVVPAGNIILVVPEILIPVFQKSCDTEPRLSGVRIVAGGKTRSESVYHGLQAMSENFRYVAIHDAGRPFLTAGLLRRSFDAARKTGAAVVCHKICETVKSANADLRIQATLPRDPLWAAETPQTFDVRLLYPAYKEALKSGETFTDDSQIVEHFTEIHPEVVENREINLKITYAEDLEKSRLCMVR